MALEGGVLGLPGSVPYDEEQASLAPGAQRPALVA